LAARLNTTGALVAEKRGVAEKLALDRASDSDLDEAEGAVGLAAERVQTLSTALTQLDQQIAEAERALVEARVQARGRALDPALTANDDATARRRMEDAAFRRDRLQTAVTRLQDRLKEVRVQALVIAGVLERRPDADPAAVLCVRIAKRDKQSKASQAAA
jgi:chromosome segregation ATPase